MIGTLVAMTPAIVVLLAAGFITVGLAYWLALMSEGKDEWLTGDDE